MAAPVFPAFLKLEHQRDGSARSSFLAEVAAIGNDAKRSFEQSFGEIGGILQRSLASFKSGSLGFSVDIPGLRQVAADASFAVERLAAMRDAAAKLARDTGDTSAATAKYVQALQAQVREAEQAHRAAETQVTTYSRLQAEIDRTVAANDRLAQSYRDTFAEQAKAANYAHSYQSGINQVFAPGLSGPAKSAASSASVFENQSYAPKADVRDGLQRLRDGAASLDRAAVAGVTLEQILGRVATKGPQVAAAFREAEDAAASAAERQAKAARETAIADAKAAAEKDKLVAATNALRSSLDPTIAIQQRFNSAMDIADRSFEQGVIGAREYAAIQQGLQRDLQESYAAIVNVGRAQEDSARKGTTANQNVINSTRALRTASLQAGQQLQDVAISLYSGQKAGVVFAQQLPQLAFALSGLEGSANKTHDRIGRFATFLSGPWGLAVGLAVGVAGSLIAELLGIGEEVDKATPKVYDFSRGLKIMELNARDSADAMKQLADATKSAIAVQGDFLTSNSALAQQAVSTIEARLAANQARLAQLKQEAGSFTLDPTEVAGRIAERSKLSGDITSDQAALASARQAAVNAEIAASQRRVNDELDAGTAALTKYNEEVGKLNQRRQESVDDQIGATNAGRFISQAEYQREFERLTRQKNAAVEAARAAKSDTNRQFGREIDSGQARSIAQAAGFQVNSADRTYSQQKALYDRWVAQGRPKDNPVAVPGSSAHERGNALDIQFADGVTPASIRKAYADEGVKLTKILKERGHYHIEWSTSGADKVEREAQQLQQFGERAGESIQRINERFNEQPRLVDQAAQAIRQLDDIVRDLSERKPAGFEQMIADAQKAKAAVEDALVRPFRDMERDSQRRTQLQDLIVHGREAEASALQEVWRLEQQLGPLSEQRKQQVYAIAEAEQSRIEALRTQQEMIGRYLDASRSVRQEIEAIFAGEGSLKNFGQIFKRLNAQVITEQLFGSMFRDLDKWVQRNTGLGKATDAFTQSTEKAGAAADTFADRLLAAADRINGASGGSQGSLTDLALGRGAANDNGARAAAGALGIGGNIAGIASLGSALLDPITVTGKSSGATRVKLDTNTAAGISPEIFAQMLGRNIGDVIGAQLSDVLGPQLSRTLGSVLGGAFGGGAVGGTTGAILGALKEIPGIPKELGKVLGKGLEGAATGSLIAGLGNSFGIKMSNTGAQVGGALGSIIPGVGSVIGSVVGGLLGGLFKKTPYGSAAVSNGSVTVGGNNTEAKSSASSAGDAVNSALNSIVNRLGGTLGQYAVSIGLNNGNWNVNPGTVTGKIGTKQQKDSIDFKKDADAALAWAIKNAIQDGAIQGVRAGTQAILKAAKDIDQGVQDALDFESIFSRLKAYNDPVGAALDSLDKEFARYKQLAITAGEGMSEVEQLYGKERVKIIDQINQQILGSMKNLYSSLTVGDTGLSLRERQANAQAAYDPLAARVAAGDTAAYDDFTAAAQTLLDISRQLYGSQDQYFSIFDQIRDLTKNTIDKQNDIAAIAAGRDSPFSSSSVAANDNAAVVTAIEQMGYSIVGALNAQLSATNANLGNLAEILQQGLANGSIVPAWQYAGNW